MVIQVVRQLQHEQQVWSLVTNIAKETISRANTTIIGDYVLGCYKNDDSKWVVQCMGNATLQSVVLSLQHNNLDVQKRYIFILIGHNQIMSSTKGTVADAVAEIVQEIRFKNQSARIYFAAILPRPIDNDNTKPLIVKFNRNLFAAVARVSKTIKKVKFLVVQHRFIHHSKPVTGLFNSDLITLNEAGAKTLKSSLFELAGFAMNA